MMLSRWQEALHRVHACPEGVAWANSAKATTHGDAWAECPKAAWLAWWLYRLNLHPKTVGGKRHKEITCAIVALFEVVQSHLVPEDLARLDIVRQWAQNEDQDTTEIEAAVAHMPRFVPGNPPPALYWLLHSCMPPSPDDPYPQSSRAADVRAAVAYIDTILPTAAETFRAMVPWVPWLRWEYPGFEKSK
jgi:hypothetical protein